jgi:hypothetical protein
LAFIRLADLIINTDCIATVKFSTYAASGMENDIPVVNLCLMLPDGSVDGEIESKSTRLESTENLEFEGDLALAIWNYFLTSDSVTVLFE